MTSFVGKSFDKLRVVLIESEWKKIIEMFAIISYFIKMPKTAKKINRMWLISSLFANSSKI